jgi:hypothetical protein
MQETIFLYLAAMSNAGKWILSGIFMSVVMGTATGLFYTLSERHTDDIREKFGRNTEFNNEFSRDPFYETPFRLKRFTKKVYYKLSCLTLNFILNLQIDIYLTVINTWLKWL